MHADLARPPVRRFLGNYNVNALPSSEKERLLVDISAAARHLEMLCMLVQHAKCELSYKASVHGVSCMDHMHACRKGCSLALAASLLVLSELLPLLSSPALLPAPASHLPRPSR